MENYKNFQLEDFLLDESFIRWAREECSPQEQAFWEDWINKHPEKQDIVNQARLIVSGLQVEPYRDISESEFQEQLQQIRSQTHRKRPLIQRLSVWASAAVFFLLLGIGWSVWFQRSQSQNTLYAQLIEKAPTDLIEKINDSDTTLLVRLSDGSRVILQPNSRISFKAQFTGPKREVYLSGEALFDVQKNPNQPFFVHANEIVTKVLGTSFTVKAYESQTSVQVAVRSGRVSVFARNDWQRGEKEINSNVPGLVLTPNQQAIFNRQESHFQRTLTPNPVIVDQQPTHAFIYDDTPVTEIFEQLEVAYGVDIVFDEQILQHCTVTARLQDEALLEKLNLICQMIKCSYQIIDAQIVISSKGCP
jgi:transmembrane sensor